ncbi:MAG: MFS transporter, partial [Peptostreptococcaceae bacterium]
NIAWIIGGVLFLRSGFANASNPIQQSLPLTFVPKNLAPAYSSFILISNSIVGIFAGIFARYSLLKTDAGYGQAYYIASTLYFIAAVLLLVVFIKKYNRGLSEEEIKEHEVKEEFVEAK